MAANVYPTMVRIRNEGQTTFQAKYAGQRYNLTPGQDTFIPWDAACLWFGHPFAVDVPGDKRKRYRSDELRRLYVKYGVYERHDQAANKFPKVSVWDIAEPGKRYTTVVEDPEGRELNSAVITQADNEGLQAQIKAMQEQMAMMQAQLTNNIATESDGRTDTASARPEIRDEPLDNLPSEDDIDSIPSDTPNRPKVAQRSG